MLPSRPPRRSTRRHGLAAVELLLVAPVLLGLATGMIGLADLIIAEQKVDEASGRAARVAALGGSDDQIEAAVRATLGPDRAKHANIHLTPIRAPRDAGAGGGHDDRPEKGDGATDEDKGTGHLELIEVRVEIEVRHIATTRFVPTAGTDKLVGRTVVQRQ